MELAGTVVSLAIAVKTLSDDATENVSLCQSLGRRAELVPRLLEKFPDFSAIDDQILLNLFDILKQSHDLISEYRKKGAIFRFLKSGALKERFNGMEDDIAKCIDELTLCVGIDSAAKIESIRIDFKNQFYASNADSEAVETVIESKEHKIDYTSIKFEVKRGIRRETGSEEHFRSYFASLGLDEQLVVVKEPVLSGDKTNAPFSERWMSDVNVLAELSHFSLCRVLGGGVEYIDDESNPPETVSQLFVVNERLTGGSLSQHVQGACSSENSGLEVSDALHHAHTIASGLHYLHSCLPKISHGALSPDSIILNSSGRCRLTDILLRPDQLDLGGSPDVQWRAPEVVKGAPPSCASDMYSFGLVLCFMLSGSPPYSSTYSTERDVREAIVSGVRPARPRTDTFLQELIELCLSAEPSNRPTAMSVCKALLAACKERGVNPEGFEEKEVASLSESKGSKGQDEVGQDSDSEGDVADFGELSDRVENLSAAVKVFGRELLVSSSSDAKGPCVVAYGDKIVVLDMKTPSAGDGHGKSTGTELDEEEEEDDYKGDGVQHQRVAENEESSCAGTVVFHIDCTSSMKRDNRMELTQEVLLRVIPSLLQKGLRVWINSWASDNETKGRIQTREVSLPDASFLEMDKLDELRAHVRSTAFSILTPNGRTDLYGSCFQLLRQCKEIIKEGKPIYAFVLTDGNHNRLDYPLHKPARPGEDYFGVYKAVLMNGTKFGLSHEEFSIEYAENFLKGELDALHALCDRTNQSRKDAEAMVSVTIIGIGDASTKGLSSLSSRLGDKCCFYGITEVSQADPAFGNISGGGEGSKISISLSGVLSLPLSYTVDNGEVVSGCGVISDQALVEILHDASSIVLSDKSRDIELSAVGATYARTTQMSIEEFVSAIRQIRSECYSVTSESFQTVFRQLLEDKKAIWGIKASFFSKKTRKLRHYAAFAGIGVWIRELEGMVDAQISSYRMNVEGEVLKGLLGKEVGGSALGAQEVKESSGQFQPSDMVLERLQNNLKNAGRAVHKVDRHVSTIRNIRDRTLKICAGLLSSDLDLRLLPDGVILNILSSNGKQRESKWLAPVVHHEVDDAVVDAIRAAVTTSSIFGTQSAQGLNSHLMSVVDMNLTEDDSMQLCFPCVLVQARYDPFTIVHVPQMFTVTDIYTPAVNGRDQEVKESSSSVPVYCAHEVWDLCSTSGHTPSATIPGFEEGVDCKPNMIIPLAHTPLLFSLYAERGRVLHSAINITGDCLAMTQMSSQWSKMFVDALLLPRSHPRKREWMDVGIKSLVSFSYAIDAHVVSPSKDAIVDMFETELPVIPRDVDKSGILCSFSLSSIASTKDVLFTQTHWNKLLLTVFSRLAETIAGHKNIRSASSRDPGEIEKPYRFHLGALQGALRKRLHVEWTQSSLSEKIDSVKENPGVVKDLLFAVAREYLSKLGEYNLPLWSTMLGSIEDILYLTGIGIGSLRDMYKSCADMSDLLDHMCAVVPNKSAFTLPIFSDVMGSPGQVMLRDVTDSDIEALVWYVDALVATKAAPKVEYKPVLNPSYPTFTSSQNRELNIEMARIEWDTKLPVANVSIIGNVNSGKSSIGGKLLEELHFVDQRSMDKLGAKAKELGYSTDLRHAWLMDKEAQERAGGFTINPKWNGFQTNSRRFTLIDNPGHKDYVTNTSTGVYHADAVVLVVPALISEINLAEMSRSQAEEHMLCAFCFGVKQLVVVVNKMDLVGFSQAAFEEVCQLTLKKVKKAGFKTDNVCFVPVSALSGDGLVSSSPQMEWYDGPCFLQALDEVHLPKRQEEKTLRMVVDQTFKVGGVGTVVCGKVERGKVSTGDAVSVYPDGPVNQRVRSMEAHHHNVTTAYPGDDIGMVLAGKNTHFKRGMIITLASNPPVPRMQTFEAQVFVTKRVPFKAGYSPIIICHLASVVVRVTRLVSIIDRNNNVVESDPSEAKASQICICEFQAMSPFVGETIHENPRLSRFLIRENRLIVAMGFIRSSLS